METDNMSTHSRSLCEVNELSGKNQTRDKAKISGVMLTAPRLFEARWLGSGSFAAWVLYTL
jgi:hypothetical protein